MIKGNIWISEKVQSSFNEDECVYKQKPSFYIKMNNQLLEQCDWCPFENNNCEVCGGLDEILMHECYDCDKCNQWGKNEPIPPY